LCMVDECLRGSALVVQAWLRLVAPSISQYPDVHLSGLLSATFVGGA
jgi:hypothetical protein